MKVLYIVSVWLALLGPSFVVGEDLSDNVRDEIISQVVDQLANRYVDPNLGKMAAKAIKQKQEQGTYAQLDQKAALLQTLIVDMQEATQDRHLQLIDPAIFSQAGPTGSNSMQPNIQVFNPNATSQGDVRQNQLIQEMLKRMNYGLRGIEVLEGNIGYLDIRQFTSPRMAPEVYQAIAKTMETFQECSSMILDLRFCSAGGDPEIVMYIISYFMEDEESQLLYESFNRENTKIAEFRTSTDIQGKCMPYIPLYILVSSKTFSAGEMFAYGLQKISRAKVIGETTAGAAHGTDTIGIGHGIMMVLPVNRLAHVKTKTSWEKTGVIPDIPAQVDEALDVAKNLISKG